MKSFLLDEFTGQLALTMEQTPCSSGAFEVTVKDTLIHSKLTMGHGKCQSDDELDNIIDNIKKAIGSQ